MQIGNPNQHQQIEVNKYANYNNNIKNNKPHLRRETFYSLLGGYIIAYEHIERYASKHELKSTRRTIERF